MSDEMRKPLGENLALYHPEKWHAWIGPGGVSFISSGFIYFLGNTNNGGMNYPGGLIQLTTVTRDPRSAE